MTKWIAIAALLLATTACGDDDDDTTADASVDARASDTGADAPHQHMGDADTTADAALESGADDATADADVTPDATADGSDDADVTPDAGDDATVEGFMCTEAQRTYLDENDAMVTDDSTSSALACFGDSDARACFYTEMIEEHEYGETVLAMDGDTTCLSCIADQLECVQAHCLGDCLSDPGSDDCISCRCDNGCYNVFDECAGTMTEAANCTSK